MSKLHRNQLNRRLWEQARRDERMWPFNHRQQNLLELKERRAIFKTSEKKPVQFWDVDSTTIDELRYKIQTESLFPRELFFKTPTGATIKDDVVAGITKGFIDARTARLEMLRTSFKEPPNPPVTLIELETECWYEFFIRGSMSQTAYITRDHEIEVQNGNYTPYDFLYALKNGVVKKLHTVEIYEKGVIET